MAAAGIADSTLWLRGGFPDSLLAPDDTQSLDWRRDFIRSYLERDVPMFAPRLPVETIGDGGNLGKRLVKSPKVYVRDSGLLHGLLELETLNALLGHPVCGLSYEGHCIENLIQAAGNRRTPYFYRTQVGAEIDLVLEQGGQPEIAIEVKRAMAPSPEKGFCLACDDLQIAQRYVVYPGTERIPLRHGPQAIGLQELVALLAQD